MNKLPEDLANRAADPERLMDGEDPSTTDLSDAVHWMKVYSELIGLKDDLLAVARGRTGALDAPAAEEIKTTDIALLTAERERFEHRLDFWKSHHRSLEGS